MLPKRLNKKTLTKKETQDIINNGAIFEPALSAVFNSNSPNQAKIYKLLDNTFLYVYKSVTSSGKSDIFSKEVFEQWLLAAKAAKRYNDLKIVGSYDWFLYFSQYKEDLISEIDTCISNLADVLGLKVSDLDFSLQSLEMLTVKILQLGIENNEEKLVDGIVAYTGEILRKAIDGQWRLIEFYKTPGIYKEISNYEKFNWYSPVNQVWEAFYDPANFPLKKLVREEMTKFKINKGKIKAWTG